MASRTERLIKRLGIKAPATSPEMPEGKAGKIMSRLGITPPKPAAAPAPKPTAPAPPPARLAAAESPGDFAEPRITREEFPGFDPSQYRGEERPLYRQIEQAAEQQAVVSPPVDVSAEAARRRQARGVGIPGPAAAPDEKQRVFRGLLSGEVDVSSVRPEDVPWEEFAYVEGMQPLAQLGMQNPQQAYEYLRSVQYSRTGAAPAAQRQATYAPAPATAAREAFMSGLTLGGTGDQAPGRTTAERAAGFVGSVAGALAPTAVAGITGGAGAVGLASRFLPFVRGAGTAARIARAGIAGLGTGATIGAGEEAVRAAVRPDYEVEGAAGRVGRRALTYGGFGAASAGLGASGEALGRAVPAIGRAAGAFAGRAPGVARTVGGVAEGAGAGGIVSGVEGVYGAIVNRDQAKSIAEQAWEGAKEEGLENLTEALILGLVRKFIPIDRAAIRQAAETVKQQVGPNATVDQYTQALQQYTEATTQPRTDEAMGEAWANAAATQAANRREALLAEAMKGGYSEAQAYGDLRAQGAADVESQRANTARWQDTVRRAELMNRTEALVGPAEAERVITAMETATNDEWAGVLDRMEQQRGVSTAQQEARLQRARGLLSPTSAQRFVAEMATATNEEFEDAMTALTQRQTSQAGRTAQLEAVMPADRARNLGALMTGRSDADFQNLLQTLQEGRKAPSAGREAFIDRQRIAQDLFEGEVQQNFLRETAVLSDKDFADLVGELTGQPTTVESLRAARPPVTAEAPPAEPSPPTPVAGQPPVQPTPSPAAPAVTPPPTAPAAVDVSTIKPGTRVTWKVGAADYRGKADKVVTRKGETMLMVTRDDGKRVAVSPANITKVAGKRGAGTITPAPQATPQVAPQATQQAAPVSQPSVTQQTAPAQPRGAIKAPPSPTMQADRQAEITQKRQAHVGTGTPEAIASNSNAKVWYHGTGKGDLSASKVEPTAFTDIDSLFGVGFYLTDDPKVAESYAAKRGKKTGTPTLYETRVNVNRVLDLEAPITPDVTKLLADSSYPEFRDDIEKFAAKPGATFDSVFSDLREAVAEASAGEMRSKSEFVEMFDEIPAKFKQAGYDAFTHTGGVKTNNPIHRVLILLDPNDTLARTGRTNQITTLRPVSTGGTEVSKPSEAKAPTKSLQTQLQSNRSRAESEYQLTREAVLEPDPYSAFDDAMEKVPVATQKRFQVHGIAIDAEQNLLNLLENGISSERILHSGPPSSEAGAGYGVASTRTRTPYLLLSDADKSLVDTGIRHVVVNGISSANLDLLKKNFPNVRFMTPTQAADWMQAQDTSMKTIPPATKTKPPSAKAQQPAVKPAPTPTAEAPTFPEAQQTMLTKVLAAPAVTPERVLQAKNGNLVVEWSDQKGRKQETLIRTDGSVKVSPRQDQRTGLWKVLEGLLKEEAGFIRLRKPTPELSPALKKLSEKTLWLGEKPTTGARTTKEKLQDVGQWVNRARLSISRALFDPQAFTKWKMALAGAKGAKELPVDADPLLRMDLMRRAIPGKTADGVTRLKTILEPLGEDLTHYLMYADARTLLQRYKSKGFTAEEGTAVITPKEAQDIITEIEQRPDVDKFKKAFEAEQKHFDEWLNEAVTEGSLTDEDRKAARQAFMDDNGMMHYVPLYRRRVPTQTTAVLKRQKGGTEDHLDPILRRVLYYARLSNAIERSKALSAFERLNAMLPEADRFMEVDDAPKSSDKPLTNIIQRLESMGFDASDLTNVDAMIKLIMPTATETGLDPKRERRVTFVRDGVRQFHKVTNEDMWEAIVDSDPVTTNVLAKVLQTSTKVVKAGATVSPGFTIANLIKDQVSAWAFAPRVDLPGQNLARSIMMALRKSDQPLVRRVIREGLKQGGFMSPEGMTKIMKSDITQPYKGTLHPKNIARPFQWLWDQWGNIRSGTEFGPRLGEYGLERERRLAQGQDPETAHLRALQSAAKITLDFTRAGRLTRVIDRYVPFFKIPFEVAYRVNEMAMTRPGLLLGKMVIPSLAFGILQAALMGDDERYKRATDAERDKYFLLPFGKGLLRIPKPDGLMNVLINLGERTTRAGLQEDPDAWRQFGKSVVRELFPGPSNAALDLSVLLATQNVGGLTLTNDFPVVPRRELGRSPKEQYGPETGRAYVAAGQAAGVSPRITEAAFERLLPGWTGAYKVLEDAVRRGKDEIPASASPTLEMLGLTRFTSQPGVTKPGVAYSKFYELQDKADRVHNDLKAKIERQVGHVVDMDKLRPSEVKIGSSLIKELNSEDLKLLKQRKNIAAFGKRISTVRQALDAVETRPGSAEEKRANMNKLIERLTETSEAALKLLTK